MFLLLPLTLFSELFAVSFDMLALQEMISHMYCLNTLPCLFTNCITLFNSEAMLLTFPLLHSFVNTYYLFHSSDKFVRKEINALPFKMSGKKSCPCP